MLYRTRTYVAADWTGDSDAVEQLYKWNTSKYWSLHFSDAHDLTQARDSSLNCSIKDSLAQRLNASKTFILIVGDNTINLRSGGCQYCNSYNAYVRYCTHGYSVDYRSYIEYECEKAIKDNLDVIVLYNSTNIHREKCPEILRYKGKHVAMRYLAGYTTGWDYDAVRNAVIF